MVDVTLRLPGGDEVPVTLPAVPHVGEWVVLQGDTFAVDLVTHHLGDGGGHVVCRLHEVSAGVVAERLNPAAVDELEPFELRA